MAAGDLYTGRIQYLGLGEEMENRFHISHLVGNGFAFALAGGLEAAFVGAMQAVQSVEVLHTNIVVVNLDDPTDFTTILTGGNGLVAGDAASPFVSWGYTFFSSDRRIRSGGCRVGGLAESSITEGVADPTITAALLFLEGQFNNSFEDVALNNEYKIVMHTEGNEATSGAALTAPLRSVLYRRVTTQSSRKFSG